ncbi:MAG: HTH-type transcriptional regulator IscR [bacterium ADurb.Bin431]|mgnify:FL=1|nr:MAG: HTH-type transcriptional regulator IscR [bacterium ADurb.Bin431]HNY92546.1 Rrf2 family transcriptional regulator [bacterium]HOH08880.1 Rrf2 family transcriptional regulator [bacterium]
MILSKSCDHAIRATLYVAMHPDRGYVPIREIAAGLGISFHFLTKILQVLTQKNIMTSFKGPNGGIALARPAEEIALKEIVLAIDGEGLFRGCMVGLDHCDDDHPCPLHEQWSALRGDLDELFSRTSVAHLAGRARAEGLRLTDLLPGELTKQNAGPDSSRR